MSNTFGFGILLPSTAGNLDIIRSSTYCGAPQNGNWFVALTSGGSDAFSLELTSPLIVGNSYSISFYDRTCSPYPAGNSIEVGVSNSNNNFGNLVYTAPTPTYNGGWTLRTFSFIAPINGLYMTVRCSGVNNGGPWTQVDNFSFNCSINTNLGNDTTLCQGQSIALNGGTASSYLWSNGSTTSSINVSSSGTFWVQASNGACSAADTVVISMGQYPTPNLGNDTTLCQGQSIALNGGTASSYLWSNGSTTSSINVSSSGIFWVQASNGACSAADTVVISMGQIPIPNLGNDTTLCQGQGVILNGGAASSYLWSNGSTNSSINVSSSGTFWVQASNGACSVADTVVISMGQYPIPNLGNDTTLCQGQSIALNGGTASSYLWSNGSTASSINVSSSGTFWVQASNGACSAADTVVISMGQIPIPNLGNDTTLCQGQGVILNGGAASSYLWSNGSTTSSINVSSSGTFWVQASNGSCSAADTVVISMGQYPTPNLGNDTTLCLGQSIALNGGTASSYLWSNGSTTSSINVSSSGTFWVQASNGACSAADTVVISMGQYPTPNLGNDTTLCQGQSIALNGGTASSYLWSNGSTTSSINVSSSGTFWVQASNGACSAADTVVISMGQYPTPNLGNDTTLCQGQSIALNGGTASSYLWSNGSTTSSINVSSSGTFWVQASNGACSAADTVVISMGQYPTLNLYNDTILCPGQNLILDATTPNTSYLWQDNSANPTFNVTQQGTYWVEVTNNCGSTADTINVSYNTLPIVYLGNDTSLCMGETLTLDANTFDATYLWHNNSSNSTFNVFQQGTYWVEVTNNCGTATDTIIVNYLPLPVISLGNDTTLCLGEILILNATLSNASYLWQDNSTNPTFEVNQQGTYWVEVTNNCATTDSINVNYHPLAIVNFGNDITICEGEILTLDANTTNGTYLWQDNSINSIFHVSQQGTYWVEVTNNCEVVSDTIVVEMENCNCVLIIQNAFTPNNDGKNDKFSPHTICDYNEYNFMIFNRWGEKVFETNNHEESWDGMFRGEMSPIGVFAYLIKYSFSNEIKTKTKFGTFTLIR